ncbi:MAG: ATP-dependent zinc metalloprotease FtsH [Paludibacteraceae bacterium]|nr:ATP-dependent zinc metalloprotease FtsH [Paludibacteraceae bacterium]
MSNNTQNTNKPPQNQPNLPKMKFNWYWLYGIVAVVLIILHFTDDQVALKEVEYGTFKKYVEKGYVDKVTIIKNEGIAEVSLQPNDTTALIEIFGATQAVNHTKAPQLTVQIPSSDRFDEYISNNPNIDVRYEERKDFFNSIMSFAPLLFFILLWIFMMRRMGGGPQGGIFNVGKSKAQLFDKETSAHKVTFKDVAGLEGAKQEVEEIVAFLKNPKRYTDLGGKIPKGALLVGPPGTGKTLLAKAVAGEANVPFFSMSGSDFVEMFVGVGASRVRDLFRQAKEKSPCIIFIDEIDAIGRARGKNPSFNSNDERENTLNQLLTEMDGFGSNSGVIILAATNRADILDKALLRAGRFDRQISVDLPDVHERNEIFKVHLRPLKTAEDLNIDFLAKQTPGFSGADIANVCNEAALIAARKNKKAVEKQDFLDAVDRIIGGLEKKTKITTLSEKKSIATHEAGHASVSWLLEFANPLVKVTIVPRGKALGAAWYLPEERQLTTKEQMLDEMCSLLGGRAAEEVCFGKVSTGALNDLERATKMAYAMVVYYGMSDKLKNISFYDSTQADYSFTKPYSDNTAEIIDQEMQSIVSEQYERAKTIISTNREKHQALADLLVENEVIFTEDVERIFGKRPWVSRMDELMNENKKNEPADATQPNDNSEPEAEIEEQPIEPNQEL